MIPRVTEIARALAGKVNKFMTDQENDKINNRLEASFNQLRTERSYTDEGIEKISENDGRAQHSESGRCRRPVGKAQSGENSGAGCGYEPTNWSFGQEGDEAELKSLWADDDKWLNKEIGKALADSRKSNREE